MTGGVYRWYRREGWGANDVPPDRTKAGSMAIKLGQRKTARGVREASSFILRGNGIDDRAIDCWWTSPWRYPGQAS